MKRRDFALTLPAAAALSSLPLVQAHAQAGKTTLTLGMTLEPPGLDPTAGAASAIAELTQTAEREFEEALTQLDRMFGSPRDEELTKSA